jgi:hypothetical protein
LFDEEKGKWEIKTPKQLATFIKGCCTSRKEPYIEVSKVKSHARKTTLNKLSLLSLKPTKQLNIPQKVLPLTKNNPLTQIYLSLLGIL